MGELLIIFIGVIIAAVVLQFLLYKDKLGNNTIFILNIVLVLVVSFITYTALPSNYNTQRIIAIAWSAVALLALTLKSRSKESLATSKILLTIAVLGSILQMLI